VKDIVALASLVTLAAGCIFPKAGTLPPPATAVEVARAQTRWPDANEATLATGRDLFASHCNACHSYPDVAAIPEDRWGPILEKMSRKAGLDQGQDEAVLRFILVARVGSAP
jgi:cytochrome c5